MSLADKYREKVANGTAVYRNSVKKQQDAKEALEKEKKAAAERWRKEQAKITKQTQLLEQNQLEMWGMAVLASGFADKYPDGFEKLQEILSEYGKSVEKITESTEESFGELVGDAG